MRFLLMALLLAGCKGPCPEGQVYRTADCHTYTTLVQQVIGKVTVMMPQAHTHCDKRWCEPELTK